VGIGLGVKVGAGVLVSVEVIVTVGESVAVVDGLAVNVPVGDASGRAAISTGSVVLEHAVIIIPMMSMIDILDSKTHHIHELHSSE
jgi:hypothetical protein